nr:glycosyltransferase family 4 protein [Paenibacillus hamazuiensis]
MFVFGKKTKRLPSREIRDGVVYIRPQVRKKGGYIYRVNRELKLLQPDVIQVENRPRFVLFLRKRHPRTPIWLSLHSLNFVSRPYISRVQLKRCCEAADLIIVNSEYLRERITRLVPGIRSKVRINHLGVDLERFKSRWEDEGRRLRQQMMTGQGLEGRKIILYVGRWIEQKGIHRLLEAMPDIVREVPEAMLIIIGGASYGSNRITPYVRELYRLARKVPKHVRFVDFVPHDRIEDWYRIADVQVVPSLSKEAFGLVNVEAMATGVPVIGTNVGGVGEVIVHGVTGFLLEPDHLGEHLPKAAVTLLKHDELRRCMAEQCLRHVREHFTWEHTAARWLDMIRER